MGGRIISYQEARPCAPAAVEGQWEGRPGVASAATPAVPLPVRVVGRGGGSGGVPFPEACVRASQITPRVSGKISSAVGLPRCCVISKLWTNKLYIAIGPFFLTRTLVTVIR